MEDLKETISTNAQGPAEAQSDAGRVRQHSLQDQIAADKYLRTRDAQARKNRGIRCLKIVPPGAGGN